MSVAELTPGSGPRLTSSGLTHRQVMVIFGSLMLGMALASIDQTVVATALPTIVGDLGGLDHLSWVVTSYLLAETVATPLYGKLGDLVGRKRAFQTAIAIFLLGSALSGLSQSMFQLVVFRGVQGLGGGGILVTAQAIIADVVSPRERARYQGYFGAVFGITTVAGPLLGGLITDHLSWRWIFYVNLPIGGAALLATSAVLPKSPTRAIPRLDIAGSAVMSLAITCFVLLTTWGGSEFEWDSLVIIGLGAATVALVLILIRVERRAEDPLLPLRLFRERTFVIGSVVSVFVGVALFGTVTYLPTFLQIANGASASNAGMLLIPLMLTLLAMSILSGQIISRTGRYRWFPVVGMGVLTAGMWLLSTLGTGSSRLQSGLYMMMVGADIGLTMQVVILATQNEAPPGDMGVATSSVSCFRAVGGAVGVAVFGALFNAQLRRELGAAADTAALTPEAVQAMSPEQRAPIADAFAASISGVFRVAAPMMVIGWIATWFLREHPQRARVLRVDAGPAGDDATGGDTIPLAH